MKVLNRQDSSNMPKELTVTRTEPLYKKALLEKKIKTKLVGKIVSFLRKSHMKAKMKLNFSGCHIRNTTE